jgi:hypothetical protein
MARVGRPISFSWHAARALRAAGWSYPEIGQALGVSHHAVMYACDPYYRKRKRIQNRARAGGVEGSVGQAADARMRAIGDPGQEVGLTARARAIRGRGL